MKRSTLWRSGLGAALASAVLAVAFATPAAAASLPDGSKTANLHITKLQTPAGAAGDGTQLSSLPNTPIPGVQFTIKKVNTIDLTTQAGWQSASALATSYNAAAPTTVPAAESAITSANYTLAAPASGTTTPQTTNASGVADFTGLPLGLYLVEETGTPAGVTAAAPFLVTLPLTDPKSTGTWNYDVYVYPKNAVSAASKTVDDASAHGLGDPLSYTVTADIPDPTGTPATAPLTGYLLSDALDPKLGYTGSTIALKDGTAVPAADYTVTTSGTTTVEVRFNDAGLALLGQHRDTQVVWTIGAVTKAAGSISNTAYLYPDGPSVTSHDTPGDTSHPGIPTAPVVTKWGDVTVLKKSSAGAALAGATFQVYVTNSKSTKPVVGTDTPVAINGTSSWTTDASGLATISGLRYSGFADNTTVTDGAAGYNYYWLVETKAPAGFELQAEPIGFTVDDTTTTSGTDVTVTDVPSNAGFALPFTGGTGSTGVTLAGLGLIVAAALAALVLYRRRRSAATHG